MIPFMLGGGCFTNRVVVWGCSASCVSFGARYLVTCSQSQEKITPRARPPTRRNTSSDEKRLPTHGRPPCSGVGGTTTGRRSHEDSWPLLARSVRRKWTGGTLEQ